MSSMFVGSVEHREKTKGHFKTVEVLKFTSTYHPAARDQVWVCAHVGVGNAVKYPYIQLKDAIPLMNHYLRQIGNTPICTFQSRIKGSLLGLAGNNKFQGEYPCMPTTLGLLHPLYIYLAKRVLARANRMRQPPENILRANNDHMNERSRIVTLIFKIAHIITRLYLWGNLVG